LRGFGISKTLLKSIVAAIVTGAAAYAAADFAATISPRTGFSESLLIVLVGGAVGVLAYTAMVFVLNISEAKSLTRMLSRR
jgi:hypothetical protein